MAQSKLDIIAKIDVQGLEKLASDFDNVTKGLNISGRLGSEVVAVQEQFKLTIENMKKQIASGTLDPETLGLAQLEYNLNLVFKSLGGKAEKVFAESLLKFSNDIFDLNMQIAAGEKRSSEITKQISGLGKPDKMAAEARQRAGTTSKVNIKDTSKIPDEIKRLQEALKADTGNKRLEDQIKTYQQYLEVVKENETQIANLKKQGAKVDEQLAQNRTNLNVKQAEKAKFLAANEVKLNDAQLKLAPTQQGVTKARKDAQNVTRELTKLEKDNEKAARQNAKSTNQSADSLAKKATAAAAYYVVFNQLKRVFNDTIRTIFQMDKAMTEAATVTAMNREEAWKLLGAYQNLARGTGLATSEIAGVVTQFLRQGRSIGDAMKLAEVAAKSAKVASISANDAVNFLTSAVNGFGLAASQSEEIADKFAAIAAQSASSFQELALAMSKVAPTAKSAGVSVDFMMGVIAKGIETTREAPENIGTAFKTIFARMREVTDLGKAMEDGMNLNRVEKALLSVDVPLRDLSGQFRNLEEVLIDVGNKWETLTSVEQAYLATALAGSRQQPRLLAIFNDFARTKELIQVSAEATGELANQHYEYMAGSEAALTNLRTSWEQLTMAFVDSEAIILIVQNLAGALKNLADVFSGAGTAADNFRVIIFGVGLLAFVMMSKKIAGVVFGFQQLIASATGTGVVMSVLNKKIRMTTKEFQALTFAQQQNILTSGKQMFTFKSLGGAMKAAGGKALVAAKAFALLAIKIIAIVAVVAAVIAAIGLLTGLIKIPAQDADFFAKKVAKVNKELSELNRKVKDVEKLTDRFKQLAKQSARTAAEMEEMASINEQLSEFELDGETFNITRTDLTGRIVINDDEYDRFTRAVKDKREEFLKSNIAQFNLAYSKDMEGTLNNPVLMGVFEKIGYSFGLTFVEGFGDGIDQQLTDRLLVAAEAAADNFTPEQFMTEGFFIGRGRMGIVGENFAKDEDGNFLRFASEEAAQAYIEELRDSGEIGEILAGYMLDSIKQGTVEIIDEDAYKDFIENTLGLAKNIFEGLDSDIDRIVRGTEEGVNRTSQIFDARADAYADAVAYFERTIDDPELLEQAITFLGQTMPDEAILNDLINNKKIGANVIATMSVDLSIKGIQNLFNTLEEEFSKKIEDLEGLTGSELQDFRNSLGLAFLDLFSNNASALDDGFATLRNGLEETGQYTEDEIKRIILNVSNMIKTLSTKEVATMLKDQMDLAKKIFDLPNQIAKGDFSQFAELVEEYGLDATKAILSGDAAQLEKFFDAQNQKAIAQIDESIEKIHATAKALGRTLTDTEKQQIAALDLMRTYYSDIATEEQLRNFRLNEAKNTLKQMNDILALQQKLIDLGLGGPIIDIFSNMADNFYGDTIGLLTTQLTDDLAGLDEFMKDGFFDPDEFGAGQAQVEKTLETFTQLIDSVTAAYTRQKKEIQERYNAEINGIKDSHSERWSMIDYTDKLRDAEEKIIEARRKLSGLAISGVSRGTLEQTQNDLKKLQQERQKIIEQQMVDEAEKELQQQMDEELIEVQTELTSVLTDLITSMEGYRNAFLEILKPENRTPITGNNFVFDPPMLEQMGFVADATGELVVVNRDLTKGIIDLTRAIRGQPPENETDTTTRRTGTRIRVPETFDDLTMIQRM